MSAALCMLFGNRDFRIARLALQSAFRYLPNIERAYFAIPSWQKEHQWSAHIAHLAPPGLKVIEVAGAETWDEVAGVKWSMFDEASNHVDWILSLDDDDGILGTVDLDAVPSQGMFHSDVFLFARCDTPSLAVGDAILRPSHKIVNRRDVHMFRGSFVGYRSEAWRSIAGRLDRTSTDFEDWRTVWHLLNVGWEDCHIPQALQFHRYGPQKEPKRPWKDVLDELEAAWWTGK